MSAQASSAQPQTGNSGGTPAFIRLWNDNTRREQLARIEALHLQACDREGRVAWEEANKVHAKLPAQMRIDLPSPRVFARLLGLYRSVAMLKFRPMTDLQLSAADIAQTLNYGKSIVEAGLRWLGAGPITYRGRQVACGLGYIARNRRTARALVAGALKNVYRTSCTALTQVGRALVGLEEAAKAKAKAKRPTKPVAKRQCKEASAPKPCEAHVTSSKGGALSPNIREVIANAWKKIDPTGERYTEKDRRRTRDNEPPNASNGWGRRHFVSPSSA